MKGTYEAKISRAISLSLLNVKQLRILTIFDAGTATIFWQASKKKKVDIKQGTTITLN